MLLSTHLQDLKETTQDILYETFRTERLSSATASATNLEVLAAGATAGAPGGGEELAAHVKQKEGQIKRDQERLREKESAVLAEIEKKRLELANKQEALKALESK